MNESLRQIVPILSNRCIADEVWEMTLARDKAWDIQAGQFVNILVPGFFLRRPISVCDYDEQSLTIIYKTFGEGTKVLSQMKRGETVDLLVGLGNGFDVTVKTIRPLLVGGGVGVPPLFKLAKVLVKKGASPSMIMGFSSAKDAFYIEEFRRISEGRVHIATVDGSMGTKGFVTDIIDALPKGSADYLFACGPVPMLKALHKYSYPAQLSFEERMGCGFGGCMGCTHKTTNGYKRICLEGPVLRKEDILW